jgi:hypothetical protein
MDLEKLQRELIAAARAQPPSDRVPYAFEGRIIARLRAATPLDWWGLWARALWRAAAPCVATMLLLGAWAWFDSARPAPPTKPVTPDVSQELENTVLAAAEQEAPADPLW